jgi:hemolysin III
MAKRLQKPKEEFVNALSHGVGLGCALVGIPFLIQRSLESSLWFTWIGAACFSLGVLMVYTFSTLYHASRVLRWKNKLQVLDHISIYFLIAGSYTPMIFAVLPFQKALLFLAILWGSVLIGTFFKIFYTGRFKALSLVLYLLMGWIAVFFVREISDKVGIETLSWIAAGGLAYTAGVYFYVKSNRLYYHFIWHLFVLAGTAAHFVAVYQLVGYR